MIGDDHLYLDIDDLYGRGWTETLVRRFLGSPDRWTPVDHWANYTGKRRYYLERIETAEASEEFGRAYQVSVKRRGIDPNKESAFQVARGDTTGLVKGWHEQLTPEERRTHAIIELAAGELDEARKRGYRTPHQG